MSKPFLMLSTLSLLALASGCSDDSGSVPGPVGSNTPAGGGAPGELEPGNGTSRPSTGGGEAGPGNPLLPQDGGGAEAIGTPPLATPQGDEPATPVVTPPPVPVAVEKARVAVLTDISNEPDDEESLVRLLVYANEMDVEALIATTSTYLENETREDLIRRQLDAYEQVQPNLSVHASGFPTADFLRARTATGQPGYGQPFVGQGRATDGSRLLTEVIDRDDPRPVWVSVWGGPNTLAQALSDVRDSRTPEELAEFVAKIRVYAISDQDLTGGWIREEFPDLFYIVSPSDQGSGDYRFATWTGISGDRHYNNGPRYQFELVDNPWLTENVIEDHGPLGALYPTLDYIMEGDTPAWFGLINNGLGWYLSPTYGGWGGRYALLQPAGEPREIWTNNNAQTRDRFEYAPGQVNTSDQATIWRWRDDYQYDFAARMDWCVADTFAEANHNPVAALNGDLTKAVLTIPARGGSTLALSADGSSDPDGNEVAGEWFLYREAGTLNAPAAALSTTNGLTTEVTIPEVDSAGTLHVVLQVQDSGNPPLTSYRRAILEVTP